MRAAYYTKLGSARDVLRLGEVDTPSPGLGDIRVRAHAKKCKGAIFREGEAPNRRSPVQPVV